MESSWEDETAEWRQPFIPQPEINPIGERLVQSDVMPVRLRPVLLVLGTLLGCQLLAGLEAQSRPGAPILSKAQWRDDLRYFARELAQRHKNLFHSTTREQFERAVAELDA